MNAALSSELPASCYRLSTRTSALVVLACATAEVTFRDGRVLVRFSHAADHDVTALWTERIEPDTWITVEGWNPPRVPPFPPDGLWCSFRVSARLRARGPEGFVAERARARAGGSEFLFSRSVPPRRAGLTTFASDGRACAGIGAGVAENRTIPNANSGSSEQPVLEKESNTS